MESSSHKEMASFSFEATSKPSGRNNPLQDKKAEKTTFVCEIMSLITCIALIWMLLLIPIVIFHLPDSFYVVDQTKDQTAGGAMECSSAAPYPAQGGVCQGVLEDILVGCGTGEMPLVLRNNEASARLLIPALMLSPSSECVSAAVPLLCLHLFGLCDSSGVSVQPTSNQCRNVRDNLCSAEWQGAAMSGFELPNCEVFPEEEASCLDSIMSADIDTSSIFLNFSAPELLPCQENFFRPEGTAACIASCHTWSIASRSVTISTDVIIAFSAIIGFLTGLVVLAISLLRFKKIFSFPSIFIVYMNSDVVIISFFMIITFLDRSSLYCSSENLLAAMPTSFCVISGILLTYILPQLAVWWLFHTSALLWKIGFPLHARSFEMSGKTKYIHMACAIVGFAAPLIPVIAQMIAFDREVQSSDELQAANVTFWSGGLGFVFSGIPPVLCAGRNWRVGYYTHTLPINVIFFAGIAELILLFGVVHKQHGLFAEKRSMTSRFKIGTGERKLLIALCFYVLLLLIAIPTLTLNTRVGPLLQEKLEHYFTCEAEGVNPDNPGLCDEPRDAYRKLIYPELVATSYVLLDLFPVVFLLYTVNFAELKEKWTNLCHKKRKSDSLSQSGMQSTKVTLP